MIWDFVEQARRFEREAHSILAVHEGSRSRVVSLRDTFKRIDKLSIKQADLLKQAIRCAEHELYRAAHVMAWAALMDLLEEKLASDGLVRLAQIHAKWPCESLEELRENIGEFQLIQAARELGLLGKNEMKALHGLLNKRNECAHPSDFFPDLNETLGFVAEVIRRTTTLMQRTL